jgi:hypothetical protein
VHRCAQKLIDPRLITLALRPKPRKNVGINSNGERFLDGAIEFPNDSTAPVGQLRNVREVDFALR